MVLDRRGFLGLGAKSAVAAAGLGLVPDSIRRALAIPAVAGNGSIEDIQHVVIFMQENRSFDHYFGHLAGVRGYNDRFPIPLPGGLPVWHQPARHASSPPVLPFHLDTSTTSAQCLGDLDHSWVLTHQAINGGRYDGWPRTKTDLTMGYHLRSDLPYHYALADAFTICDHYFCSLPGPTHPNRCYLMSASIDPSGTRGGPLLNNTDYVDGAKPPAFPLLSWTTYPERLQQAGVSWRIYQQGLDWRDPIHGNFGCNILMNFEAYVHAPVDSPLYQEAMQVHTLEALKQDVLANRLPQVSWLIPPAAFSEHPQATPAYGADYLATILDALTANPEVWSRTVLLVMYDENDGLFDHLPPPQPAMNEQQGRSTVSVDEERHDLSNPLRHGDPRADGLPYGLGPRVPMTVISPWSRGGYVCSQVFDHTSVLRFLEARFGVHEPQISPWRRAICGDLTSAFDFSRRDTRKVFLPDTSDYRMQADQQCRQQPAPQVPTMPVPVPPQESGVRPSRALPYAMAVDAVAASEQGVVNLSFANRGKQGMHLLVVTEAQLLGPWRYSIEAGKQLAVDLPRLGSPDQRYAYAAYGPNGYFRQFEGTGRDPLQLAELAADDSRSVVLEVRNTGSSSLHIVIADQAYGAAPLQLSVQPNQLLRQVISVHKQNGWYDLSVRIAQAPGYLRRLAGRLEDGSISSSDPAATTVVLQGLSWAKDYPSLQALAGV